MQLVTDEELDIDQIINAPVINHFKWVFMENEIWYEIYENTYSVI